MVKGRPKSRPVNAPAEVVFDPSASGARKPRRAGAPSKSSEWHNFMGSSLSDMYRKPALEKTTDISDEEPDIDIAKMLKDDELFGASTWKERKQIENRKVVELGGKAIKKHRTPLSVAKPAMKNQMKIEQRKVEEERRYLGNEIQRTQGDRRALQEWYTRREASFGTTKAIGQGCARAEDEKGQKKGKGDAEGRQKEETLRFTL